jgi:hypothetical protein
MLLYIFGGRHILRYSLTIVLIVMLPYMLLPRPTNFQFISPHPDSRYNRRQTTITIRQGQPLLWTSSISHSAIQVSGSISGWHAYSVVLSDDQKTLVIKPELPFAAAETVMVSLDDHIKDEAGAPIGPFQFSFVIGSTEVQKTSSMLEEISGAGAIQNTSETSPSPSLLKSSDSSIPSNFPVIKVRINKFQQPRLNLYLGDMVFQNNIVMSPYLMVLDDFARPIFYRNMQLQTLDFERQPNGTMTYFDSYITKYVVLDNNYAPIDTISCGNGYATDLHELRILPNGHIFLLGIDIQPVAMDALVPGGKSLAYVKGLVIQELDQNKNVVFQWRSWDYFSITDAIGVDFTSSDIDPVHGNALEIDSDTSLILSSRHLSEITKIDRRTGDIIWRWGGKNNQFQFINDTMGFSYQHAIRKIANGHFTLFDNGNFHSPPISRAVEYALDEHAKTATLVWSYRHTPDIFGSAMGYVQRLDDGSTLISWGATNPSVTILDAKDSTMFEMSLPQGVFSYRAYAYPVQTVTGISPITNLPATTILNQNYPNPFNPSTEISYSLSSSGPVSLVVYDLLGREVATLVQDYEIAGNHSVRFDASPVASGVYFYRLSTGTTSIMKKMVLLR